MKSVVRPELPTASVGSSQAPTAAVDNSAPLLTTPESTYKSGKSVQTTGATSAAIYPVRVMDAVIFGRAALHMRINEAKITPLSERCNNEYLTETYHRDGTPNLSENVINLSCAAKTCESLLFR